MTAQSKIKAVIDGPEYINKPHVCFWDFWEGFYNDGDDAFLTGCGKTFPFTGNPNTTKTCYCPNCKRVIKVQGYQEGGQCE